MARYVVDASVAVKWYVPEEGSQRAAAILEGGHELLAPELLLAEFGNIIWKKVSRGLLSGAVGGEIVAAFLQTAPVATFPVHPYLPAAYELAVQYRCTVYDGLYLALAVAEGCPLLTADARLAQGLERQALGRYVALL